MKVSLLSTTVCLPAQAVIEYFENKEFAIDCVIIEKNLRKKFSINEKKFRKVHDAFNRKTKKYSPIRRMARRLWGFVPFFLKRYIVVNIYHLPFLNKFSLRKFCEKHSIPFVEVERHSSNSTRNIISERHIDYLLMVSSNWLLKEPILSIPGTKIINAHSGWLPKHKGLDSIAWSLKEKDRVGLTTHFINEGIDSGDILRFYEAKVDIKDDFNKIHNKVGSLQPHAFYDTLMGLYKNEIIPQEQQGEYLPHFPMSLDELCDVEAHLTI